MLRLVDFSSYFKQCRVCETHQRYLCFNCMKNIQPSPSLALNKIGVDTIAFDQISFEALNFFRFPFFVAELWLHLLERWLSQCHAVVAGHLAYQFVNPCCHELGSQRNTIFKRIIWRF